MILIAEAQLLFQIQMEDVWGFGGFFCVFVVWFFWGLFFAFLKQGNLTALQYWGIILLLFRFPQQQLEVLIIFIVAMPDLFQSYSAKLFRNHRYM